MEDNVLYFSQDEIDMINYIKDVRDIVFSDEYDEANFAGRDEVSAAFRSGAGLNSGTKLGNIGMPTFLNKDTTVSDYRKQRTKNIKKMANLARKAEVANDNKRYNKIINAGMNRIKSMDKAYKLGEGSNKA